MRQAASRVWRLVGVVAAMGLLSSCWGHVGAGPENRRFNPFEKGITTANAATLRPVWSVDYDGWLSAENALSEPIVADGRVYFRQMSRVDIPGGSSQWDIRARALDEATGAARWTTTLSSFQVPEAGLSSTPINLATDDLWVSYTVFDGRGAALSRLDPETGAVLSSEPGTGTAVVGGRGVVASMRETLVVRDSRTLATLWTASGGPCISAQVVIVRDSVVTTCGSTVQAYAVAGCGAPTCGPIWSARITSGHTLNQLAVGPGHQVVVASNFDFTTGAFVRSYDLRTGQQLWDNPIAGWITGLATTDDRVVVATSEVARIAPQPPSGEHSLVAFGGDGGQLWKALLFGGPNGLVVGGDVVYTGVGRYSGLPNAVEAFDVDGCGAPTCDHVASIPMEGFPIPRSVTNGKLYVTSDLPVDGDRARLTALAPSAAGPQS